MQRIKRSAHAPVGTALFLFVGLAILPVSLRATGVQISVSPRLAAAMDAWQQIAEVFGASYHPTPASELSVVRELDSAPAESSVSPGSTKSACASRAEVSTGTELDATEAGSVKAALARRAASRPALRRSLSSNQVALLAAADALKASFEKQAPAIGALGALKVATLKRGELLKSIDKRLFKSTFGPIDEVRKFPGSKNIRVLVNLRRAVAGSSAKAAERKVFLALASARRRECDRALLTGLTTVTPDHSEF